MAYLPESHFRSMRLQSKDRRLIDSLYRNDSRKIANTHL